MSAVRPVFSVVTPTFNRAHTLTRVFESLLAQSFRAFEWIIVDDGSTDSTTDLVCGWLPGSPFPIRYLRQANRGKGAATNLAVREARGDLVLPLDSDDSCVANALETFLAHWLSIPERQRSGFVGVTALCLDQSGRGIGSPFPTSPLDSDCLDVYYRIKHRDEMWGFARADVLREFPFPEIGSHVPEAIVWFAIASHYKTRFVNDRLRVYWQDQSRRITTDDPAKDIAAGQVLWTRQILNSDLSWFVHDPLFFLRSAANYCRFSSHLRVGPRDQRMLLVSRTARCLWWIAVPAGQLLAWRDRFRARSR